MDKCSRFALDRGSTREKWLPRKLSGGITHIRQMKPQRWLLRDCHIHGKGEFLDIQVILDKLGVKISQIPASQI